MKQISMEIYNYLREENPPTPSQQCKHVALHSLRR